MGLEIVRAAIPRDIEILKELDICIFKGADVCDEDTWFLCDNYILYANGLPSGSTSLLPDHCDDSGVRGVFPKEPGTLYIVSTGVLSRCQGMGLGLLFKTFHMSYAKMGGFRKVLTCARVSNVPIINLNKKFGFLPIGVVPAYYKDPEEDRIVLQYTAH